MYIYICIVIKMPQKLTTTACFIHEVNNKPAGVNVLLYSAKCCRICVGCQQKYNI